MTMLFDQPDRITLIKKDGTIIKEIRAWVQSKVIFIGDGKLPIEEGDIIERILPNKLLEGYRVLDRGYFSQPEPHYQVKFERVNSPSQKKVPVKREVNKLDFENLLHPIIRDKTYQLFLEGHYRESTLNSIVAVFDLIREKTGLTGDGENLITTALSLRDPTLILSDLESESGRNDQKGFLQIYQGAYIGIRNPKSHTLSHDLTKEKAAQYMIFASLLARRIDEANIIKEKIL